MIDETTDESNKEQVVICFRWVDDELDVHEDFFGLYETESTEAIALLTIIHDVLSISIIKLRGQCYDGASAMSGCKAGVAKLILDEEPRAIYTHCFGHSLNLACNDTIKQCAIVWEEALEYVKETDMRSRIIGVKTCMRTFDFLFGIMLGELLLRHSDNLSKTLQSRHMSAAEGQKVAAMTVKTLKSLRTDESFQAFWELVQKTANELEVECPSLPRKRRAPRRYDSIGIDRIVNGIEMRFDQPGFQTYKKLENVLLKAANKEYYDDDIEFITQLYGSDLNLQQLMHIVQQFATVKHCI
ncbi:hypothetical protein EMCRGX_G000052 [Ephydatia muelleri]